MKTITCKAGHDLKAGELIYIHNDKKHWFKRLILWIAFWYTPKPVVYKVDTVSETEFTYTHDPEGIFCPTCRQKHNPFFKCESPWLNQ